MRFDRDGMISSSSVALLTGLWRAIVTAILFAPKHDRPLGPS